MLTNQISATQRVTKTHHHAGAQAIAGRVQTGDGGGTLSYLHTDHLGSTSLTTDAAGAVVARQSYCPYGSVRSATGTLPTDRTFTGQYVEDASAVGSLMCPL